VTERTTGRPAQRAFIDATIRADSITYRTTVDSSSFFALRYLAPGIYDIAAWADLNGNGKRDPSEPASARQARPINRDRDTVVVELAVVPFDTVPARITRGEARDSQQIRLVSDDWLEPGPRLGQVQVTILHLPDSVEVPGPHALMSVDSFNALPRAEPDTAAADTTAAPDTLAAADTLAGDSLARRGPPRIGAGRPPPMAGLRGAGPPRGASNPFGAPTEPLPFQELVLVPSTPLEAGAKYLVDIRGLLNISGLPNGGGEVEITLPAPRPPPPDTSGIRAAAMRLRR